MGCPQSRYEKPLGDVAVSITGEAGPDTTGCSSEANNHGGSPPAGGCPKRGKMNLPYFMQENGCTKGGLTVAVDIDQRLPFR